MLRPTLSIVVLTCSQAPTTLRLLDSLSSFLANNESVEMVVVDNGSTDHRSVRQWLDASPIPASRFKILTLGKNRGVAAGRNAGIRASAGEKILLLDNDTIAVDGTIEACMAHLDANPRCGLCAPALFSAEGELQSSAKPFPGVAIKLAHILCRHELARERSELNNPHPFYLIGAFQMIRREALTEVGLLDEAIFYGPEDADFCIRLRQTGWTIDYLPRHRFIHQWRRATRRSPLSSMAMRHLRGLVHFYIRHRRFLT